MIRHGPTSMKPPAPGPWDAGTLASAASSQKFRPSWRPFAEASAFTPGLMCKLGLMADGGQVVCAGLIHVYVYALHAYAKCRANANATEAKAKGRTGEFTNPLYNKTTER